MTDASPIAVIGAGGHGKVVLSTLLAAGHAVAGFFDDDRGRHGSEILGVEVLGAPSDMIGLGIHRAILGIGSNRVRRQLDGLDLEWPSLAHPAACVDRSAGLDPGSVVFAGAVVQPDCRLGRHCIVNTAALVDHDCRVGDYAHIAPGARIAGGVSIGAGSLLGIGCAVLPGVTIGDWAIIGAGAVVVGDVPDGATVKGVPAH